MSNQSNSPSSSLKTMIKVTAFAVFSLSAGYTQAAVSPQLDAFNTQWAEAFSAKNLPVVKSYYDDSSIVASFPYKAEANLKGADAIGQMFQNGPFKLEGFNVKVTPLGFEQHQKTALLLKYWHVSHKGGEFSGLAVEVLNNTRDGWKRKIDMAAAGLAKAADFAKQEATQVRTFDSLDISNANVSQLDVPQQNTALNRAISAAIAGNNYQNITSIINDNQGLLIARVAHDGHDYLTFNALEQQNGNWTVNVQLISALNQK